MSSPSSSLVRRYDEVDDEGKLPSPLPIRGSIGCRITSSTQEHSWRSARRFTDTRSEYWSGATFIAGGVLAGALWWQGSEGMKKANAYLVDALIFDRVRAPSVEAVADLSIPPTDYARASR
jgi:hypothetical protein